MMDMPIARMPPHLRKSVQHLNQERSLPNVVMLCEECLTRLSRPPVYSPCFFFFFKWRTEKKRYFGPRNTRKSIRDPRECRGGPPPPPPKKLKRKKMLRCEMGECRKRYDFRPPTPDFRLRDFLFTQPAQHGRRPSERPEPSATKASAGESVREEEPCLRGAARRVDWARDERGTEAGDLGGRL